MNQLSGAEAFVRMLQFHGVRHIFGLCGDTSLPLYDALYRLDHGITHMLARDERSAAYMADAYARVTGRVGVCEGPSGGGATYMVPGVVEANKSSIPVLAVTTDIAVGSRGRYVLTELDQEALFRPLTKWTRVIDQRGQIPATVRAAFRQMTTGRPGAAHIGLPFDVQRAPVDEADVHADPTLGAFRRGGPRPSPRDRGRGRSDPERQASVADLWRRAGDRRCRDRAPGARRAVGGAGRDHDQRPGLPARGPSAGVRRGRQQRRHARDPSPGRAGRSRGVRRLPGGLGHDRALAPSGAGQGPGRAHRRRPGGNRHQLSDRGRDRRRCAPGARSASRRGGRTPGRLPPDRARGRDARRSPARKPKNRGVRGLARSDAVPIRPERIVATLQALLPGMRSSSPTPARLAPISRPTTSARRGGSSSATGRMARSAMRCRRRSAPRSAGRGPLRRGHGRWQLRLCRRRARDDRKAGPADHDRRDRECDLRLDQGRAEERFRGPLLRGRFLARPARPDRRGLRHPSWRVEAPADLKPALARALAADGPALVDVVTQPLHEARAPVSEWIA